MMEKPLIPVVIVGIQNRIGLALVRDLGRHRVPVYGFSTDPAAPALVSRYLHKGYVRAPEEPAFIDQLAALGHRLGQACLIAHVECDIALLNRHRHQLHAFRFLFPDDAHMQRVVNKEQTYLTAQKIGIAVPRTAQIRSLDEIAHVLGTWQFPVVLKWPNPYAVMPALAKVGLPFEKSHYCYCASELLHYVRQFASINQFPLIQEYCPGDGLGISMFVAGGHACQVFQHRRIHEWPPEGGVSSMAQSEAPAPALVAQSVALLRALDWEGIAMVEYRMDPTTGQAVLMEVNGRYWGSLALASHAGVSFPWLAYQAMILHQPIRPIPYRSGIRLRCMIEETKRLLRILFQQHRIADQSLRYWRLPELCRYFIDFFRPHTAYPLLQRDDLMPFVRDTRALLYRLAQRLFR
ncbi:ATP-grasp domain-containing protein [Noviherbaspirillum massiliense]|uniref:carboxylate--amine ligase n=1 Tax=Noviherbaspirillum massiliense TaxID=1465823 RepID=UPI00030F5D96|nr:ATP-grasp domain-containing protein [Noviherbaspirillum massiliense]